MPSLLYYDPGTAAQVDEIERIVCEACPIAQVRRARRGDLHWIHSILLPLDLGRVAYLEPFPLSPIRWRHLFLVSDSGRVFIQNDHAKRLGEYDNTDAHAIVAAALRYRAAVLTATAPTTPTTTEDR